MLPELGQQAGRVPTCISAVQGLADQLNSVQSAVSGIQSNVLRLNALKPEINIGVLRNRGHGVAFGESYAWCKVERVEPCHFGQVDKLINCSCNRA